MNGTGGLGAPWPRPEPLPPSLEILLQEAWWGVRQFPAAAVPAADAAALDAHLEVLDSRWWGTQSSSSGVTARGSSTAAEHHAFPGEQHRGDANPARFGWWSWLLARLSHGRQTAPAQAVEQKRGNGRRAARTGSFTHPSQLCGGAPPPRIPRRPSAPKLQPPSTATTDNAQPTAPGQHSEAAKGRSRGGSIKSANFAERRQAWRQR